MAWKGCVDDFGAYGVCKSFKGETPSNAHIAYAHLVRYGCLEEWAFLLPRSP